VLEDYGRAGSSGQQVSARTGEGVAELRQWCRDRRGLFVGHSGVGKSTLLNALFPGLDLLVGRVNPKTGKGRHTTSAAWLVRPEPDLELIDTPGMRTFGLWGIEPRHLERCFAELRGLLGRCRFADCRHESEPGCAIRAAADEGRISRRRFESYHKLRGELELEVAGGR
jgi:ribosome biogenesis GTPase